MTTPTKFLQFSNALLPIETILSGMLANFSLSQPLNIPFGITVKEDEIKEFFKIRRYMQNYFNTSKNMISDVIYFVINTDAKPDKKNTHYTSLEKEYQFHIESVDFKYLTSYVNKIVKKDGKKINRIIADELLYAYGELKRTKEFENILN